MSWLRLTAGRVYRFGYVTGVAKVGDGSVDALESQNSGLGGRSFVSGVCSQRNGEVEKAVFC